MFIRMMICIVVIAVAAPFFIPGPGGKPIMTPDMLKFDAPSMPELPSFGIGDEADSSSTSQTLYRYQDANGVWHYTDDPAMANQAEEIEVSTDINLMQAPPEAPRVSAPEVNISANPLTAITRGDQVMEDAQEVQQMLEDRLDDMDQTLDSIQ